MKTMAQMQDEMLAKARFDGGYPRHVVLHFGILALAKDEEEYKSLMRENAICSAILGAGIMVSALVFIVGILWTIYA